VVDGGRAGLPCAGIQSAGAGRRDHRAGLASLRAFHADAIARHAALRGSGRVGRSTAGRAVEARAVELAVIASIRHRDTAYDQLLMSGVDRSDARQQVRDDVDDVLERWRSR